MNRDRLDRLLEETLLTGEFPEGLTAAEHQELQRLIASASLLQPAGRAASSEAEATLPAASLRFRRHMTAAPRPEGRAPARWFAGHRTGLAVFGTAAAALVFGLALFAGYQWTTGDVETAAAIAPGDFVQLQGTIESAQNSPAGQSLRVNTALGQLDVNISPAATVSEGEAPRAASTLRPGEGLVLSGHVGKGRKIEAQSVAVSKIDRPPDVPITRLHEARESFTARVLSVALTEDGALARGVVVSGAGDRFLVHVDAAAAARLFESASTLPGTSVQVQQAPGAKRGVFELRILNGTEPAPVRPSLGEVRGTVVSRHLNELTVNTRKGPVRVQIHRGTRFSITSGALDRPVDDVSSVPLAGHTVTISGGPGPGGVFIADLVVVGAKGRGMSDAPEGTEAGS